MNTNDAMRRIGGAMMALALAGGAVVFVHDILGWGWNITALVVIALVGFSVFVAGFDPEEPPGANDVEEWESER